MNTGRSDQSDLRQVRNPRERSGLPLCICRIQNAGEIPFHG